TCDLGYYIALENLKLVRYKIITEDGFILNLYRLLNRDEDKYTTEQNNRIPVLFLHGLLQSSASFVTNGKDSLAINLFNSNKYDIWLGNNRCFFDKKSYVLKNDNNPNFWNWDLNQMYQNDLSSMINFILKVNNNNNTNKINLIAHSQGTTQSLISISNNHENISSKLVCFVALSPAIYKGKLFDKKIFIIFLNSINLFFFRLFFGILSFMPIMLNIRKLLVKNHYSIKIFGFLGYLMFNFLFDWNDKLWDRNLRNRLFLFSPVYISSKLIFWWLNDNENDGFINCSRKVFNDDIDYIHENNSIKNNNAKNNLNNTNNKSLVPMFFFIGNKDDLVSNDLLIEHFEQFENHNYKIKDYTFNTETSSIILCVKRIPNYSHLDVLWAKDVLETIGDPMSQFLDS
ncbi:alpha/beta-hydrolase, partial [Ascoidea rubescens DSM 1968]